MNHFQAQDNDHSSLDSINNTYVFPTSFAQQRLWFLDRLLCASSLYNIPWGVRLDGILDVSALQKSFAAIVERHEVLRTSFTQQGGDSQQLINASIPFHCKLVDLSTLTQDKQGIESDRILDTEANKPFNLEEAPLIRAVLLKLSAQKHILLVTFHHIISDGWSVNIFQNELAHYYRAFSQNQTVELAELPIQYADYAAWQREWLQGEVLEKQLSYWKKQLADIPTLDLPTDHSRPKQLSYQGARESIQLSSELTQDLKSLSQKNNVTLFMTLLAAFQVLLHRYSGQDDIIIGSPIAGRNKQEIENLIGFFVNSLALRTDLSGTPCFSELLSRVRKVCLEAYTHQDVPFEKLVAELQTQRDMSRHPLFQVMLVLQPTAEQTFQISGLTASKVTVPNATAKFDLSLSFRESPSGLEGAIEYSTDLFDNSTISRLAGHFQTLLKGIVDQPETSIAELPILTAPERHQLLVEWNNTQTDYPKDKCIHQLFEEQVNKTPDAIALVFEDQQLSYQELNVQANQLAHYLCTLGVSSKSLVGICLERSIDMVVALLAIFKAGGAYVPLDPAHPRDRLTYMLKDSQPQLVLTLSVTDLQYTSYSGEILNLNQCRKQVNQEVGTNIQYSATSENLAYVMYTSGSTGQPKGVMVTHSALSNHMTWMQKTFPVTNADKVLQKTPFSFDASVWEFFAPIIAGAQLILASPELHKDVPSLVHIMKTQGITIAQFVPSVLEILLQCPEISECTHLKRIFCGGEALNEKLLSSFLDKLDVVLCNLYGPTETCIDATYWVTQKMTGRSIIPIGRPIANTQIYILDQHRHPVPIGVTGEIYIGGEGLAQGYLNRPELTNKNFIADPFNNAPQARLYKTGDLARYHKDGNIEFLGRIDHQVKLRGFRIELGEIESALRIHPKVNEVLVMLREDQPGEKRLIAYLSHAQHEQLKLNDLQLFVKERLPEYMLPSAYVLLDKLPLTANGKVDRNALPSPDNTKLESRTTYVGPRSPMEKKLTGIWQDILNIERIGIYDSFFALGGHSLLAVQLIVRINQQLHSDWPLHLIFDAPTINQFAKHIDTTPTHSSAFSTSPVQLVSRNQPLKASFAQQRLWFLDQLLGPSGLYNIPWAIRLTGILSVSALQQSLTSIIAHHEILRTAFSEQDGELLQTIKPTLDFQCELTDLTQLPKKDQHSESLRILEREATKPFDLQQAPLIRALLLKLSQQEHILLVTLHHSVSDGWSMGLLRQEMQQLYYALSQNQTAELPEMPIQYADFSAWQREWLQGKVLDSQLSYWKTQLAGLTPLNLPTDHLRPKQPSYRGERVKLKLPRELSKNLKSLSQQHNVTLFMTLLATLQVLLRRYSGQDDIIVGSPIAGRNKQETEHLIGFFVNTLALRNDLSGNPEFSELLQRVRKVCLDAYAHQDVPFEKLVAELQPQRDTSRHPLFQVMLVLQPPIEQTLQLPKLTVSSVTVTNKTAKFDLTFALQESSEGLKGSIEYSTDLFNAETVQRLAGHFQTLLEGIVNQPETSIAELPILTAPERHQLLVGWNNTQTDYPQDKSIHQLFEEQAAKTPDAVALVFEDQQLSYQDLNAQANQLAYYLKSKGVIAESLVGICMKRSSDMVAGLLAILKAGGTYVPLDPTFPKDRLAFILEDTGLSVVIIQKHLQSTLPNNGTIKIIIPDGEESKKISQQSSKNLCLNIFAKQSAYLIFTSGSTGTPKGVMVPHRAISRLVFGVDYVRINAAQKFLLLAPITFDASTFELWAPLLHGAQCIIYPDRIPTSHGLEKIIQQNQISILWLTTSLFNAIIDEKPSVLNNVSQILTGGEALSKTYILRALEQLPNTQIINGYGPTENTTFTCCYNISKAITNLSSTIPIGRPIANTQVYILDEYLQPVPVGVVGEIHIGGSGLALGYHKRPELTKDKFIQHPFNNDPLARVYKSGDMARYLVDGNIEFIGRIDQQIKLRGYRIELGEIETILRKHPDIDDALLIVNEDSKSDKYLIAYVKHTQDKLPTVNELRQYLKQKLPDYMIPAFLVLIDQFPLTANGKIDRDALSALNKTNLEAEVTYVAPSSPIEKKLVDIWQAVLGIDNVGIHDNFFELGGHSLLAVRLITRIEQRVGKRLHINSLWFDAVTIAQQVELFEHFEQGSRTSPAIIIAPGEDNKRPLFCVHTIGGGNLFHYEPIANHLKYARSIYGLQAKGVDGLDKPDYSVEGMATYCIQSMQKIQASGPYYICGFSSGGTVAYEMARQLSAQGESVEKLFLLDTYSPLHPRPLPTRVYSFLRLIRDKKYRQLQEIAYHWILTHLKMHKKRQLTALGESHRWALWSYKPAGSYPGDIIFFEAEDNNTEHPPHTAWKRLIKGQIKVEIITGSHGQIVSNPELAEHIDAHLNE